MAISNDDMLGGWIPSNAEGQPKPPVFMDTYVDVNYGESGVVKNVRAESIDWDEALEFRYAIPPKEEPLNVGKKYDQGKIRLSLVPKLALIEVMKSLEYGAVKYGAQNWRKVDNLQTRYSDSAFRHLLAEALGEDLDPDIKDQEIYHLANAICGLMFKLEDLLKEED